MQTERPPTEARPSSRSSPARGVVLIAAAVVLGLFLLRALEDSAPSDGIAVDTTMPAADDGGGTEAPVDEGEDGEGDGTTTTATPEPRPPSEVVVRVANASGVGGAAGTRTEQLAGAGYQTVEAINGPEGQQLPTTQILFAGGFEPEARALAEALGVAAEDVVAMPAPPPVDPGGAQLVVLLGIDLAEG